MYLTLLPFLSTLLYRAWYVIQEKDGLRLTRLTKSTVQESHTTDGLPSVAAKQPFYDRYGSSAPGDQKWSNSSSSSHVEVASVCMHANLTSQNLFLLNTNTHTYTSKQASNHTNKQKNQVLVLDGTVRLQRQSAKLKMGFIYFQPFHIKWS